MNKTQLIDVVATKTGLKKKDAEAAVNAVNEAIVEALKAGDVIDVTGFLYWYNGPNTHITAIAPAAE